MTVSATFVGKRLALDEKRYVSRQTKLSHRSPAEGCSQSEPAESGSRSHLHNRRMARCGLLAAGCIAWLLFAFPVSADTARHRDAARDNQGGGAAADIVSATQAHRPNGILVHTVTVRGELGPRKDWPFLWLDDDQDSPHYVIDPSYEGGTFFVIESVFTGHRTSVRRIDAHTVRFVFKRRWLEQSYRDKYCWWARTEDGAEPAHDAIPDEVGLGDHGGGALGFRHILEPSDQLDPCNPR